MSRALVGCALAVGFAAAPCPRVALAEEDTPADKPKPFTLEWQDGATTFETDGFKLNLSNRLQFLFTNLSPDDSVQIPGTARGGDSIRTFRIRRAKTQLEGYFWKPELEYELQMGWAGSDATGGSATFSGLEDALLNWDASKKRTFMVQAGQFKVPFGRQELTSSERQQFVDRSILSGEFTRSRDVGVQVWGELFGGKLEYRAGAFNGNGRNRPINDNDKLQYDTRVTFQPWGSVKYSESDFESKDKPLVAFGLEFEKNDQARSTSAPPGSSLANFDDRILGFDAVVKYKGFSAYGELFLRDRDPENGQSFSANGWILQSGYFVKRDVFELAFRYATWDPSGESSSDDQSEIGGAANYYFLKHRLKLQADYRVLEDRVQDQKTKELRAQLQLVF